MMLAKRVKPTKELKPRNARHRHGSEAATQLFFSPQCVCSFTMSRRFRVLAQKEVASASKVNT